MKKFIAFLVCIVAGASGLRAEPANCEEHAESIKITSAGVVRTVKLVPFYDLDVEEKGDRYDSTQGVYFFKAKLQRGYSYTVWTEGVGTNETMSVTTYAAEVDDDSDADGPSADFEEMEEPGFEQRLILYADEWYIDEDDPAESDPKEWTYYIEVSGDVGDSLTVHFQQGVVIPQGREQNPLTLSPSLTGSTVKRKLQTNNEYYLRARLLAGRMYHFTTGGGTTNNVLDLAIDGEDPSDETKEAPTCLVYDDPAFDADEKDTGIYVVPNETGYFSLVVSGDDPETAEGETGEGGAFELSYQLLAARAMEEHTAVDLVVDGPAQTFIAGALSVLDNTTNGVYDAIIDASLFRFTAVKGDRLLAETTGAATNLLMRLYDAKGNVLGENRGDGQTSNVRGAFTVPADGVYFVGVCQYLADELYEEPSDTTAQIQLMRVTSLDGSPDAWDRADDEPVRATALAPVPGEATDAPETLDAEGNGWHRLGRTDWADVFRIAGRKGLVYSLRVSLQDPAAAFNSLKAEVFTLSGTSEREVLTLGDVNAGAGEALSFAATANATYYIRLSVAEGQGLDYPAYKVHAKAYSLEGAVLGMLTVNTYGTPDGTFSLGSETVKYPGGSSVLVSGAQTVKFGAVSGFSTPAAQQVDVAAGTTPTVVDVYYSDTFDPKDDSAATATAWTLKATETTMARTLWPTDHADNFALTGTDGSYYELELRDVTGDAVFSITNALVGTIVENVTKVHQLTLPKSAAKYILTVKHGTEAKAGGSYTLAGSFANVGAIKLAKTALSAKENAPSIVLTVNRTAKAGVVRVKYTTVDGTAKAGEDYVAQEGVLEWVDGDNKAKTITLKTIPDLVATYDGNKTFAVKLAALPADELGANEYPATFVGGDTCTITLTEVSTAGTTAATTYAAKQPKVATTTTETVPLESGTFYGVLQAEEGSLTNGLPQLASVTFTASTAVPEKAVLSAKVMLAGKTYTFKATGWDVVKEKTCVKTFELVQKVNNVVYTNRLCVGVSRGRTDGDGDWQKGYGEVELYMNVPDANNKGVQTNIGYEGALFRQNAKIQDYLTAVTNFTGYYTFALVPQGVTAADGVPTGNGYLTVTIDNKGTAKVAGMLADGTTKISCSVAACGLLADSSSLNGYSLWLPVYFAKNPCCFGGFLRLTAQAGTDLPSGATTQVVARPEALVWNNDNAALTYAGKEGYQLKIVPCGGWYDQIFNLQTYYKSAALAVGTASIAEFPKEALPEGFVYSSAVEPNGFGLDLTGDTVLAEKNKLVKTGALVDFAASVNPCKVQIKFARATGLYSGSCSLWSEREDGAAQKEIAGLKHFGVFVLARDEAAPLAAKTIGAGFVTQKVNLTDYNEATKRTTTRNWSFSAPFNVQVSNEE
ncbi:MAG: Calx-beta domain-containing protein [bacterium]|nr:Calx-beta domain-containing protein [bacterium]